MPKETFYNLPEDKKKRILDAAAEEIVRVPASEMSINKIIQKADISRGSFYQYFDDKHDLIQVPEECDNIFGFVQIKDRKGSLCMIWKISKYSDQIFFVR